MTSMSLSIVVHTCSNSLHRSIRVKSVQTSCMTAFFSLRKWLWLDFAAPVQAFVSALLYASVRM